MQHRVARIWVREMSAKFLGLLVWHEEMCNIQKSSKYIYFIHSKCGFLG